MNDIDERLRRAVDSIVNDAPLGDDLFTVIERRLQAEHRRKVVMFSGLAVAAAILAAVVTITAVRDAPARRRVSVGAPSAISTPAPTSPPPQPAIAPPALGAVVSPPTARPGATITVAGTVPVPGCPARGSTILQSDFPWSHGTVPDFVATPYDTAGHFTITAALPANITGGAHGFLIRCAGKNETLGPAAGGEIGGQSASAMFTVTAP